MRSSALRITCSCLALLPAAAFGQFADLVDAGGGLYLVSRPGVAWVASPGVGDWGGRAPGSIPGGPSTSDFSERTVEPRAFVLPGRPSLHKLVPTGSGWIASGTLPSGAGEDLYLLRGEGDVLRPFAGPENVDGAALRHWATPLLADGELAALAWLEGEDVIDSEVRVATWSGVDWGPAETVSPPGPGTQTALEGAALADGSWLLVWTAFDGEDDEVVWSRHGPEGWSEPAPLHLPNDVPDILPAVVATGRGALAAWSRFDGNDYRLRIARFEEGVWTETDFEGGRGSQDPGFFATESGGAVLVFSTVSPQLWSAVELDAHGRVVRRADVPELPYLRPALVDFAGEMVRFEWPDLEGGGPARAVEAPWRVDP